MTIPVPPVGGHTKLRLLHIPEGQVWYRIGHRRYPSALHFSKGPDARWNPPDEDYGVIYLADHPATDDLDITDILDEQGWGLV